ncbi:microfibril-associated glycoprotein 4-like [Eucyclogobius newberryi]|uniref:microfibril-associated glycoprotein 4-like n=1 Tax=Eucyclogobius newberryi TaxID=166745 RepID=UPI003B5A4D79
MASVLVLVFLAPLMICCRATEKPVDCSDILLQDPDSSSGVYTIYPSDERLGVSVYCDMDTIQGPWTVFQRRMDVLFTGLEFLHKITARGKQELLVEMEDFEGNKASARYSSFYVGAECDGFQLTVSGFTDGGAGDSLTYHNNMKFTTFDKDQDLLSGNSAKQYLGAFWYNSGHETNPNGVYRWGADNTLSALGVEWKTWKGFDYSLKSISMKTHPVQ